MPDVAAVSAAAQALAQAIWDAEAAGKDVSAIHAAAHAGLGVLNAQPEFASNPVTVTRQTSSGPRPMTGGTGDKGSQ